MKIIGGQFKGRNFYMPKDVRPTQNILRKAVFDILGQDMEGLAFLELFAGSAAMGLEALSRGAARVTVVERDPLCVEVIGENLKLICANSYENLRQRFEIRDKDAFATIKQLALEGKKFDIVFLDPPYGRELAKKALKTLKGYDILHPNSTVVVEHDKHEKLPESEGTLILSRQNNYGKKRLSFYHPRSGETVL